MALDQLPVKMPQPEITDIVASSTVVADGERKGSAEKVTKP
ncbi:hypothetical protein AEGHOMDF_3824 [Methylobacterium soli]|nr:hypothetical protein AEGHOMDF_3824 [Methylobacterium soli]